MKNDKINIQKSIEKKRVIRETWFIEHIIDFSVYIVSISISTFFGVFVFALFINTEHLLTNTTLLGGILFGGLIFLSVVNIDKLKRISGISEEKNRQIIKKKAKQLGWKILNEDENLMEFGFHDLTNWRRQVIVIFDQKDILINSTAYGLFDLKSPFHWFGKRSSENSLIREINEKKNDTPTKN
ncbi:MAG TPA: hypothetical protein VFM65_09360 [Flavobacteriaceae bacterium]|nr:hypothetical protein [Flavobacteriaceae bacterium]